jgi:hypothetical protein
MRDNETLTEAKHSGFALVSAITGMGGGCTHIFEINSLLVNLLLGRHECNDYRRADAGKVVRGVWYVKLLLPPPWAPSPLLSSVAVIAWTTG